MNSIKIRLAPLDLKNRDHIDWMYHVRAHPKVVPFFFAPPPSQFSEHEQFLIHSVASGERAYFIIESGEDLCGYCQIVYHSDKIEVGFALHPDWWGKGVGERSAILLLEYARSHYGQKRVILFVKKDNQRAIHLYKKIGFMMQEESVDENRCMMIFRDISSEAQLLAPMSSDHSI